MDIITYGLLHKKIKKIEEELKARARFLGITTTELQDNDTTNPIVIDNQYVTAKVGDWTIVYNNPDVEFFFNGTSWQELVAAESGDYELLINKPSINGVELTQDKSFEELGRDDIKNARIKQIIDEQYDAIFGGGN